MPWSARNSDFHRRCENVRRARLAVAPRRRRHNFPADRPDREMFREPRRGESSFRCTGTTPHAPCTMNCMRNPPTISSAVPGAKIQTGIRSIPHDADMMMLRRRPHRCDMKTDHRSAADRAQGVNDGHHRFLADTEAALFFEERRIEILRAVRHVVERRHEKNGIEEQPACCLMNRANIDGLPFSLAPLPLPDRRLRNARANVDHQQRPAARRPQKARASQRWERPSSRPPRPGDSRRRSLAAEFRRTNRAPCAGSDSIASDAPSPHSPPIPIPKSARKIRKTVKFGANAVSNSITE